MGLLGFLDNWIERREKGYSKASLSKMGLKNEYQKVAYAAELKNSFKIDKKLNPNFLSLASRWTLKE